MNSTYKNYALKPGTGEFKLFLKKLQRDMSYELDSKVRSGIHEPGHGAAHMEMTLFLFLKIADIFFLSDEEKDVGSLAAILHDIWRENIYFSHTKKSALKAKLILSDTINLENENLRLTDELKDVVILLIQNHSIKSMRSKNISIPEEWLITLKVLQLADLVAQAGAFGYLRSFSYSGHVLKSMLDRIKAVIKNPKKFQDEIPYNLRRLMSESGNYFHLWIISIMMKTNRNYLQKTADEKLYEFALSLTKAGINEEIVSKLTGIQFREKLPPTEESAMFSSFQSGDHPIISDISSRITEAKKFVFHFEEFIKDLDNFAKKGFNEDSNEYNEDIENDIINLLEYGIPGMCSRAFFGQFNPIQGNGPEEEGSEYMTLNERIERFSNMLKSIKDDPASAGLKTEAGKILFQKVYNICDTLVANALEQYNSQRWTTDMWDSL